MQCKYCGGEINLSVGRCIGCGRAVDDTADIRILHDLDALVEKYNLDTESEKYDPVKPVAASEILEQRTSAVPVQNDLKEAVKPGIELHTYYELLGEEPGDSDDSQEESKQEVALQSSGRNPDYETEPENTADSEDDEIQLEPLSSPGEDRQDGTQNDVPEETADEKTEVSLLIRLRAKAEQLLDRIDALTAPVTERIRNWYNAKMPQLNRAQSSSKWERLAVVGLGAAAFVLLIAMISAIIASIPAKINGEWCVSEDNAANMFTVEFDGGEVVARVYGDDGEAHIYRQGTYDTSRKNGYDLLTITYEDGTITHLYYEIKGRTGEFVNVDTGSSDQYYRVN